MHGVKPRKRARMPPSAHICLAADAQVGYLGLVGESDINRFLTASAGKAASQNALAPKPPARKMAVESETLYGESCGTARKPRTIASY